MMLKLPMLPTSANSPPLFSGHGPSTLRGGCCGSSSVDIVVDPSVEDDSFEPSVAEGNSAVAIPMNIDSFQAQDAAQVADEDAVNMDEYSFHSSAAAVAADDDDFPKWETFPLLADFKQNPGAISDEEREKYKVIIQDGQFFRPNGSLIPLRGFPYRYVMDANGQLFLEDRDNRNSIVSHASFIGDNPVLGAGRMLVKSFENQKAHITCIDNESGHYHPSQRAVLRLTAWLRRQGVTIDKVMSVINNQLQEIPS